MTAESTQTSNTGAPQIAGRDGLPTAGMRREGATIGASVKISGELQAEEDLLIEGSFKGTLTLRNHTLAIGAKGQIQGTAFANTVTIDGTIDGDLYASERISIRKGARVKGNVLSPRVSLEDGAVLRGSVEMDPEAIKDAIKEKFGDADKPAAPKADDTKPVTAAPGGSRPTPVSSDSSKAEPNKGQPGKPEQFNKGVQPQAAAGGK